MEAINSNTQDNKLQITWQEIKTRCEKLDKNLKYYGVPRGGQYIAAALNPVDTIDECDVIIDDLIDSGETEKRYKKYNKKFIGLFNKQTEQSLFKKWLVFPWELNETPIEDNIIRLLEYIGENPNREGLKETPRRIIKMWAETMRGYDEKQKPKITTFQNGVDGIVYDELIVDNGVYYSNCEHHFIPFFGQYWFAYIPNLKGKIIGLSKVARIVDYYAAKLQIQERLCSDIVDAIEAELDCEYKPLGIGIIMKGEHLCKTMRGVKKQGLMTTSYLKGVFKTDTIARAEFLSLIK